MQLNYFCLTFLILTCSILEAGKENPNENSKSSRQNFLRRIHSSPGPTRLEKSPKELWKNNVKRNSAEDYKKLKKNDIQVENN